MKNLLKIILPTGISIIGSIVLYNYLLAQFEQMEVIPGVKNDYPSHFHYSLYFFCFAYLFALIALPFILSVVFEKWPVKKGSIGMKLLIVEVLALILVWLLSPPDLISRILNYGIWQLPIIVNFIPFRSTGYKLFVFFISLGTSVLAYFCFRHEVNFPMIGALFVFESFVGFAILFVRKS